MTRRSGATIFSKTELGRISRLEDERLTTLLESKEFRESVSDTKTKLLSSTVSIPDMLRESNHHCTVHRKDSQYIFWDKPIDDLCDAYEIDNGYDLYYSPRYQIERHVLFSEPFGNLYHPLIRCETDSKPFPHISKICIVPPRHALSRDEMNWLLADVELLMWERQPAYPISPPEAEDLFTGLKGEPWQEYKARVEEAIHKGLIADPAIDAQTLVGLIETLRDEHELPFKQIERVLGLSEGAARKRYSRFTEMPPGASIWIPPTPRSRRAAKKPRR